MTTPASLPHHAGVLLAPVFIRAKSYFKGSVRNLKQGDLLNRINLILPVGQITSCFPKWPVQPHLQKYFGSRRTQIRCISIAVSFRQEGRSRVVTSAGRDAVDARASGAHWQSQGEMNLVSDQRRAR